MGQPADGEHALMGQEGMTLVTEEDSNGTQTYLTLSHPLLLLLCMLLLFI